MKIGIIGAGNIGSRLAREWTDAGHEVMISSKNSEKHKKLVEELGPKAKLGTPEEAARFGEVVLLSIPLGEIPNLSKELRDALKGKIVVDTTNPYPERDGKYGDEALDSETGSGVWVARYLPGAKVVKGFNAVYFKVLESEAHRRKEPLAIPLASDDKEALEIASKLVEDAGYGPVIVGELRQAKLFDPGTPVSASGASVSEAQKMLSMKKRKAA